MSIELWLDNFCRNKLLSEASVGKYVEQSSVVTVELDKGLIYDLMVLMPDDLFEKEFVCRYGECFVLNEQGCVPPVFTRFKSYSWLRQDLERRLPIALWIFGKSVVVRDPRDTFKSIVSKYTADFQRNLEVITKRKYVEFRSDRHNLRQALLHQDRLACDILKANIVKLAAELQMLSMRRPYPYKKWLTNEVGKSNEGKCLLSVSRRFIDAGESGEIISISEELVQLVVSYLSHSNLLQPKVLSEWWLHLG